MLNVVLRVCVCVCVDMCMRMCFVWCYGYFVCRLLASLFECLLLLERGEGGGGVWVLLLCFILFFVGFGVFFWGGFQLREKSSRILIGICQY